MLDNNISILKHLKINRSHYGEIHISEVLIPEEYKKKNISEERRELIEESLIQFQGNIFPIIVKELSNSSYELVYGTEVCQIIKDFVKQVGEKRALELNISRIRVYSIDIESSQISDFRKTLEKIMNYKTTLPEENIIELTKEKDKPNKKLANKSKDTRSDIQKINDLFSAKQFSQLLELINSETISKNTIHQFILSHYEFDNFMNLRNLSLDFESSKDKMVKVIQDYTESNLS